MAETAFLCRKGKMLYKQITMTLDGKMVYKQSLSLKKQALISALFFAKHVASCSLCQSEIMKVEVLDEL